MNLHEALLIVDMQNDFMTGSLAVPGSEAILPLINQLQNHFELVVASKDWHPENHCSFASTHHKKPGEEIFLDGEKQILWPPHCVQGSKGAEFHPLLSTKKIEKVFYKGVDEHIDSYSAFFDNKRKSSTGLAEFLRKKSVNRLVIVGLTVEYCVKFSALDAILEGFQPIVLTDACMGIELKSGDIKKAYHEMEEEGVILLSSRDYL